MTKTTLRSLSRVYRAAARLQEALAALKPSDRRDASWPARIVLRLVKPACWLTTKALVRYDVEYVGTARRKAAEPARYVLKSSDGAPIGTIEVGPTAGVAAPISTLTLASVGDYKADDAADEARDVAREMAAREEA